MANRLVLDTSAVLAMLFNEPGANITIARGEAGILSTVSFSETIAKSLDRGIPVAMVEQTLDSLRLSVAPFDRTHARKAASFRPQTRQLNLSFADRACLATAALAGVPVLTADRIWADADTGVEVILIR